jgi:hypothetical protein
MPSRTSQVQSLQLLDDAQALLGVAEAARRRRRLARRLAGDPLELIGEGGLAGVAEGRVPQVVRQRDRLRQVLVQVQGPGYRAGDLRHLQGMGQTRDEVVPHGSDEHLRLVLEPAERLAVDDPVAVALELRPQRRGRFGGLAAAALEALRGVGGEQTLALFQAPAHGIEHAH